MVKIRHLGRALLGLAALFAFSTGIKAAKYITPVTPTADGTTYYIIQSLNRGGVLTQNGDDGTGSGVMHSDFRGAGSLWTLVPITTNTDNTAAAGFYLKNANGKYMTEGCAVTDDASSAGTFYVFSYSYTQTVDETENTTFTGTVISRSATESDIYVNNSSYYPLLDAGNNNNVAFQWYSSATDYEGTTWLFTAVDNSTVSFYTDRTDATKCPVYNIVSSRGAWNCASATTTDALSYVTAATGDNINGSDTKQQFAFLNSDSNFYIFNVGTSQFVSKEASPSVKYWWSSSAVDYQFQITDTPQSDAMQVLTSQANYTYVHYSDKTYSSTTGTSYVHNEYPFVIADGNTQMNVSNNASSAVTTDNYIVNWNSRSDDGNMVKFVKIDDSEIDATAAVAAITTYEEITLSYATLQTLIEKANTYTIGNGLNAYSEETSGAMASALATANAISVDNTTAEAIASAQTALEAAIAALTLNQPATGKFYRFASAQLDGVYALSSNITTSSKGDCLTFGTDETASIYYLTENNELLSFSTGYYLYNNTSNANRLRMNGIVASPTTYEFKAASDGSTNCYNIVYSDRVLYLNGNEGAYYADVLNYGHNWTTHLDNFTIEEVTSIPVTIGTSGYGTLYTPVALTIPEGRSVYTGAMSDDSKSVVLSEITTGIIPANTAVLVAGTSGESVSFTISSEAGTAVEDNILAGQVATIDASTITTPYTLQTIDSESGFAKFNGTELKGFKCYIENPSVATDAATLAISFEDVTGINAINAATENGNATIYDLQGRRVNAATRGLYIVNGKKVLVK